MVRDAKSRKIVSIVCLDFIFINRYVRFILSLRRDFLVFSYLCEDIDASVHEQSEPGSSSGNQSTCWVCKVVLGCIVSHPSRNIK